jgi:hypothetical protein
LPCAKQGDCRQSLCCQEENQACFRRSHLYYAQCRNAPHIKEHGPCADSDDWLCPGWEICAQPYEECTKSRCCSEHGYFCGLNETLLNAGGGWHAFCRPAPVPANATFPNETLFLSHLHNTFERFKGALNTLHSKEYATAHATMNQTSWLCERGKSEGLCDEEWHASNTDYYKYANGLAKGLEDDFEPITVVGVVLISVLSTLGLLMLVVALLIRRRRMKARLTQMELELHALRAFARNEQHGHGDRQGLIASVSSPHSPGADPGADE